MLLILTFLYNKTIVEYKPQCRALFTPCLGDLCFDISLFLLFLILSLLLLFSALFLRVALTESAIRNPAV